MQKIHFKTNFNICIGVLLTDQQVCVQSSGCSSETAKTNERGNEERQGEEWWVMRGTCGHGTARSRDCKEDGAGTLKEWKRIEN